MAISPVDSRKPRASGGDQASVSFQGAEQGLEAAEAAVVDAREAVGEAAGEVEAVEAAGEVEVVGDDASSEGAHHNRNEFQEP